MDYFTRFISADDILSANCLDIEETVSIIEKSFIDYKNGSVLLPDKISQVFDESTQNRINCMPSTLIRENISRQL